MVIAENSSSPSFCCFPFTLLNNCCRRHPLNNNENRHEPSSMPVIASDRSNNIIFPTSQEDPSTIHAILDTSSDNLISASATSTARTIIERQSYQPPTQYHEPISFGDSSGVASAFAPASASVSASVSVISVTVSAAALHHVEADYIPSDEQENGRLRFHEDDNTNPACGSVSDYNESLMPAAAAARIKCDDNEVVPKSLYMSTLVSFRALWRPLILIVLSGLPLLFATFALLHKTAIYIIILSVVSYVVTNFVMPFLLALWTPTHYLSSFQNYLLEKKYF